MFDRVSTGLNVLAQPISITFCVIFGVFTIFVGCAVGVALFHPDPERRQGARAILRDLLTFLRDLIAALIDLLTLGRAARRRDQPIARRQTRARAGTSRLRAAAHHQDAADTDTGADSKRRGGDPTGEDEDPSDGEDALADVSEDVA